MKRGLHIAIWVPAAWATLSPSMVRADIDPVSGIDFVTVGAPGNRAYDGPDPQGLVAGRGSVGYTYGIGRFEITTAQWMEYVNEFSARPDAVPGVQLGLPTVWGAETDVAYSGPGVRYRLKSNPSASMYPVGGISWRQAAMYVNWLNQDKSPALSARLSGAYDASTFGYSSSGVFSDQRTHDPNARYWIPTLDEWMKAVHYDPNASGPNGQAGRWRQQPNGSDTPLIYGPPPGFPNGSSTNQANSGFLLPNFGEWNIPLGSYPTVQTPWGLLDAAGGTEEWTEFVFSNGGRLNRLDDGSYAGSDSGLNADRPGVFGGDVPESISPWHGFRVASSIPAPSSLTVVLGCALFLQRRRRKGHPYEARQASRSVGRGLDRRDRVGTDDPR